MIENSERGITINKLLAWTIVTGLVMAGMWVGVQTTTLSAGIGELKGDLAAAIDIQSAETGRRDRLAERVRGLETKSAARDASFEHTSRSLQEMKTQLAENNRLLREMLRNSLAVAN